MAINQEIEEDMTDKSAALCVKILKAIGLQKQVVAMNALYMAMQVVDSAGFMDSKLHAEHPSLEES